MNNLKEPNDVNSDNQKDISVEKHDQKDIRPTCEKNDFDADCVNKDFKETKKKDSLSSSASFPDAGLTVPNDVSNNNQKDISAEKHEQKDIQPTCAKDHFDADCAINDFKETQKKDCLSSTDSFPEAGLMVPNNVNNDNQKDISGEKHEQKDLQPTCAKKNFHADCVIKDFKETQKKDCLSSSASFLEAGSEPPWLNPNKRSSIHFLYDAIWNVAKISPKESSGDTSQPSVEVSDTAIVYRLLLTSGLTRDMLKFIWELASKTVKGALTQSELYSVLALVALAQKGHIFKTLAILHQFPEPPVPKLDLSSIIQLNISDDPSPTFKIQPLLKVKSESDNSIDNIDHSYHRFFTIKENVVNSFLAPLNPAAEVPDSSAIGILDGDKTVTESTTPQSDKREKSFGSWRETALPKTVQTTNRRSSGVSVRKRKHKAASAFGNHVSVRIGECKLGKIISKPSDALEVEGTSGLAGSSQANKCAILPSNEKICEDSLRVTIIPDNFPNCEISSDQSHLIEAALAKEFSFLEHGVFPQFSGSFVKAGTYVITCANKETKRWVEKTVPKLKPWEGAKLKTTETNDTLKTMTKVTFKTPQSFSALDSNEILKLLKCQNKGLNTSDWIIESSVKREFGQTLTVLIDDLSLHVLKMADMQAYLGLGRISITILKQWGKGNIEKRTGRNNKYHYFSFPLIKKGE